MNLHRIFILMMVFFSQACVERSLMIESRPPGARVTLDHVFLGYTPLWVHFSHYGTRKLVLEMKNHKSVFTHLVLEAPWYETVGIGFFADVVWPGTIRDKHIFSFSMEQGEDWDGDFEKRAHQMKRKLDQETGIGMRKRNPPR
jgi:hypothetical protein